MQMEKMQNFSEGANKANFHEKNMPISNLGAIKMLLPILEWHFTVLMRYRQCLKPSLIWQTSKISPEFSSVLGKFNWKDKNHITATVNMCVSCPLCSCVYVLGAGDRRPMHKITTTASNQGTLLCQKKCRQFRYFLLFYICACAWQFN